MVIDYRSTRNAHPAAHTYCDHTQDLALRPGTSASATSRTQSRRPKTGSKEFLRRLQADLDSRETRLQVVVLHIVLICSHPLLAALTMSCSITMMARILS